MGNFLQCRGGLERHQWGGQEGMLNFSGKS